MNGIINILKPSEMTSHDVVSFVRKNFNMKKVGHTGTLDPNAAGVLPICIGKATRVAEYFSEFDKSYRGEVTLGSSTDTQDSYGIVIESSDKEVSEEEIIAAFDSLKGKIKQLPPMYSALKHNGRKLYELAREGKTIERKERNIEIYDIEIIKNYGKTKILFDVKCSKGTYVRTICNDIGEKLGTFGHMSFLMRTNVGNFNVENAHTLDEIESLREEGKLETILLPLDTPLMKYKSISFNKNYFEQLKNGMKLRIDNSKSLYEEEEILRVYCEEEFIGVGCIIGKEDESYLRMKKVLV